MLLPIKRKTIIQLFFLILISGFLFAGLIYVDNSLVKKLDISGLQKNVNEVIFSIDSIEEKDYISIRGWAYKKGINISIVECFVAVRNISTNECFRVNTIKENRPDVTKYFNDGLNYDNSGIYAKFSKRKLGKGVYEIILLYFSDNSHILVPTGKTISIS